MRIRTATMRDLDKVAAVEAACFPAAEAASREEFEERLRSYPNHFWVLEEGEEMIGFINGPVTDEQTIRDEMFADASLHKEDGEWQAIFGVNTLPEYRRRGYAAEIMKRVIAVAKAQGRRGCILTCKDRLLAYYEKFGYRNLGVSASVHGGAVWYDMCLEF